MNELLVVFYILATLAVAYLWFYPKFIGNNLKLMAWVDIIVTSIPVGISAILFWQTDPTFRFFFFFDLNWFFYTVLALFVIETPILLLYLQARGLSKEYWSHFTSGFKSDSGWTTASVKSVTKQLNDTTWDGLRTFSAKRFLLVASNSVILAGTGFLIFVGDNDLALYSLIHILLIFVFWFLLQKAVRLVADAPDEALDEMLIEKRNRSYVTAFRWLAGLVFVAATALLVYTIRSDFAPDSDGFNYLLSFTWPQVQAIFWLFAGYVFMLPSMAMLAAELQGRRPK